MNEKITDQMNFQSSKSYVKMKKDAAVVIPKTATFKDTTSKMNYDQSKKNTIGSLDYYYGSHYVGGSEIQIIEKKVEQFPFSTASAEDGEKKNVIRIDFKLIAIVIFGLIGLAALILVILYVVRNFYLLRYEFYQRRKRNLRNFSKKNRLRKRKRR